jgi:hypothetical protein
VREKGSGSETDGKGLRTVDCINMYLLRTIRKIGREVKEVYVTKPIFNSPAL